MYIQLIEHCPAPGKALELRALLEEWVTTAPARGASLNLAMPMINGTGPVFINGIRYQDLSAYQEHIDKNRSTPEFGAYMATMRPLLAAPQTGTLHQVIIPSQNTASKYLVRMITVPQVGKGAELQALLEERTRANQASGLVSGLRSRAFSSDGPEFARTVGFPDLARLEQWWASRQSEPGWKEFIAKQNTLLARPTNLEIIRILVPFA